MVSKLIMVMAPFFHSSLFFTVPLGYCHLPGKLGRKRPLGYTMPLGSPHCIVWEPLIYLTPVSKHVFRWKLLLLYNSSFFVFSPPLNGYFKVQSFLENPTTYHLQRSRDKKVQEYLSETYGNKFAPLLSAPSPKPPPSVSPGVRPGHVMSSSAGNSTPNSPMAMLNIGSNPEREVRKWLWFMGMWGFMGELVGKSFK